MKETYPKAFDRWSKESAIQRSRQIKESRLNAPSNSRQAQNFVPMAEWRVALDLLANGEDPHSSLKKSQAFLLLSYACTFPPKRADLGSVRIFPRGSEPCEEECNKHPNHIVLNDDDNRPAQDREALRMVELSIHGLLASSAYSCHRQTTMLCRVFKAWFLALDKLTMVMSQ